MKKLSKIYKELGIAFTFPIEIKDSNGKMTYRENSDGYSWMMELDANGYVTYYENSYDYWRRTERDANGYETYWENSEGDKDGTPRSQSCDGKVVEVDGGKYKLTEL